MRIVEQTRALFLQNARDARVDPDKDTRNTRLYAAQHYTIMENANALPRYASSTCVAARARLPPPESALYPRQPLAA